MPSTDPDHLDDESDDWQTAAAEHFDGDWRTHADQQRGPRTTRRPFTRFTTNNTGTTPGK